MLKLKITVTFLFTPTITAHTILLLVSTHLPVKHIHVVVIWQVTLLPFAPFLVCDIHISMSA